MRKRMIGSLEVSVVGVGCNNFGRELDADRTRSVIHAALDAGVTFFDTADQYGRPRTTSESLVGEILAPCRASVIIATKFGRRLDDGWPGADASPAYVRRATEASLKRLRTDRIDLMQVHIPDPTTPVEDTIAALSELVAEGKIREFGASNYSVTELREAAAAAQRLGSRRFVSVQASYNLLDRREERALLGECERTGISFLPYHPLHNGLLSGKYRPGVPAPASSRIGSKAPEEQARMLSQQNMARVAQLTRFAEERGHTILELAYAWLLAHAVIPSVIAGVSSPAQIVSNAAASSWELTAEEQAEVAEMTRHHA